MTQHDIFDIAIIGGGPVGLYAAFYSKLRDAKVKIIESLALLGGQPAHLYPEKMIYDIPAYPEISGAKLTDTLISQLSRFDVPIFLNEEALDIEKMVEDSTGKDYFEIRTTKGIHHSYTIIIAAGNGAFKPRKIDLPDITQFEGTQVHYFVKDLTQFSGKDVVICGGGDSAVDWAIALSRVAKQVHLVHRRPQFRAMEHSVNELATSSVNILTPYIPHQIKIADATHRMSHLVLKQVRGDDTLEIALDDLIISYGFVSSIGNIAKWGFETNRQSIVTNHHFESSIPGIYAIGDIASYDHKVNIIATGFGEAPLAINHALSHIYPERRHTHVHSSSLFEK